MDLSEKEKIGVEGGDRDVHLSYHHMGSIFPTLWTQQPNSLSLNFAQSDNTHNVLDGRPQTDPMSKDSPFFVQQGVGIHPPPLSHVTTDSAFIQQAARFSCFGGADYGPIVRPFGLNSLTDPYVNIEKAALGTVCLKSQAIMGEGSGDAIDAGNSCEHFEECRDADVECSKESPSSIGSTVKKRKRSVQSMETDQVKGECSNHTEAKKNKESTRKVEQSNFTLEDNDTINTKPNGKKVKDSSVQPKGDYIHVRARRGQATNSHSLAERVRREKISERMKFLQDLVPGCSKVTGKAVMLDEIINYVQSLQRQVEFLSMKLAAVNPQLDLNMDGLLSKHIFQSQACPSSSIAFSHDMALPLLQQNQQVLIQPVMLGMVPPLDAHRRASGSQMAGLQSYSSMLQMPSSWDEELQRAVQMGLMSSPSLNIQNTNGKNQSGFLT